MCKWTSLMSDTYKAVFECEATNERVVWYVSSREEARKHLRYHIKSWKFRTSPVLS